MVLDFTEEYGKIWKKADELAELETLQYMKCPYTHPVNVRKTDGSEVTYNRKYSRSDYKDDKRLHHILDMLSLLMNTGE